MPTNTPDQIELKDGVITYTSTAQESWSMRADDLRILSEATNEDGPFVDDYFICFACDQSKWEEASYYAEGIQEFLSDLGTYLSAPLLLSLHGSTDLANVILWPEHLAGQAMFEYHPVQSKSMIGRFTSFLLGPPAPQQVYSEVSLSELS